MRSASHRLPAWATAPASSVSIPGGRRRSGAGRQRQASGRAGLPHEAPPGPEGLSSATFTVAMSTVVHVHNALGRIYMLGVTPAHRVIAPAVWPSWRPEPARPDLVRGRYAPNGSIQGLRPTRPDAAKSRSCGLCPADTPRAGNAPPPQGQGRHHCDRFRAHH
ncbi:Phosphatidylinositol 4-phosphate 5-kinase type-1 gamma [Manis javanica]|nr:Phosphatidylinositol 4-phosphate 5-kinase type-1 gamma [Manis javanica]